MRYKSSFCSFRSSVTSEILKTIKIKKTPPKKVTVTKLIEIKKNKKKIKKIPWKILNAPRHGVKVKLNRLLTDTCAC